MKWPQSFLEFLTRNGIDVGTFGHDGDPPIPRFIRVSPRCSERAAEIIQHLQAELKTSVQPVDWLENFFSLDSTAKIVQTQAHRDGQIFGMDVSSAVAVHALSVLPDDHVLDLCCAPGAKLCFIGEEQGDENVNGTVTGVDISSQRLSTCKSLVRKHKLRRARLFCCDGTTFSVHAPSRVGSWRRLTSLRQQSLSDADQKTSERTKNTKTLPMLKPFHATKLLSCDPQIESEMLLYDKVLVDAECTHDGSIAHLIKCDASGWEQFEAYYSNEQKMNELEQLQRSLIRNGFRLLKPGGTLVYSTCSFSKRQNEEIVLWLLDVETEARVEQIPGSEAFPTATPLPLGEGIQEKVSGVLRFSPAESRTSGMFIARIGKLGPSPAGASPLSMGTVS
ncbi:S-adenosyl-L-methionine-dependent methyltransferase [Zopfochytrium polystomum]|nr:S-adenosyl-L-methionine-dependent methyltransferase [Zopfochytrium polystomum]